MLSDDFLGFINIITVNTLYFCVSKLFLLIVDHILSLMILFTHIVFLFILGMA